MIALLINQPPQGLWVCPTRGLVSHFTRNSVHPEQNLDSSLSRERSYNFVKHPTPREKSKHQLFPPLHGMSDKRRQEEEEEAKDTQEAAVGWGRNWL